MIDGEDRRRIKVFVRVRPPLERLHERGHGLGVRCVTEYDICVKGGGNGHCGSGAAATSCPSGGLFTSARSGGGSAMEGFSAFCGRTTSPTLSRRPVLPNSNAGATAGSTVHAEGADGRRRASTPTATRTRGTPPSSHRPSVVSSLSAAPATSSSHHHTPSTDSTPIPSRHTLAAAAACETNFRFDSVFDPTCTQVDVYEEVVLELLDAALQCGTNVSLLCYGPTGSGKTYSMVGAWDPSDPSTMGILPRAALQILTSIQRHRRGGDDGHDEKLVLGAQSSTAASGVGSAASPSITQTASSRSSAPATTTATAVPARLTLYAAELYLEELRDLFVVARHISSSGPSTPRSGAGTDRTPSSPRSPAGRPRSPLSGRLFQSGDAAWLPQTPSNLSSAYSSLAASTTSIPMRDNGGLAELCAQLQGQPILSLSDLRRCYDTVSSSRVTLATMLNDKSSRSHALFILKLDFVAPQTQHDASPHPSSTFVTLADLAGSERLKHSLVDGIGVLEAQSINRSLSALCSVITALHQKQKHVPFRDSKLTRLLRPCLEGGRVAALIHVPPSSLHRDEALQTLKFAERMAHVQLPPPRHAATAAADGNISDDKWYASEVHERQQEGLEVLNGEARTTMMQLAGDVRLANVAHGCLPRRLAALPLRVLQTQSPSWYAGWLHAKHVSESEAALGSTLVKKAVDRAMEATRARIEALRDVVQREVRIEADLAMTAQSADALAADAQRTTLQHLEKQLARAVRARAAAAQVKQLLLHRIGVAAEREMELRSRAHSTKVQLLDTNGSWHRQTARLDAEARLLQQETRNALVIQGLLEEQRERLMDMNAYLTARRARGDAEGLCMTAQLLGFGKLTATAVRGPPAPWGDGGGLRSSAATTAADVAVGAKAPDHQGSKQAYSAGGDAATGHGNSDDDEGEDIIHIPARLPRRIVEPSSATWSPRPLILSSERGACGVTPRPSLIGLYDHRRGRQHVAMRVMEQLGGVPVNVLYVRRGGLHHSTLLQRSARRVANEPLCGEADEPPAVAFCNNALDDGSDGTAECNRLVIGVDPPQSSEDDDDCVGWSGHRVLKLLAEPPDGGGASSSGVGAAAGASRRVIGRPVKDGSSAAAPGDNRHEEAAADLAADTLLDEVHRRRIVVQQLPPHRVTTDGSGHDVTVRVSCLLDPSKPSRHLVRIEVLCDAAGDAAGPSMPTALNGGGDGAVVMYDAVLETERPEALETILFAVQMLSDRCDDESTTPPAVRRHTGPTGGQQHVSHSRQQPCVRWVLHTTPTVVQQSDAYLVRSRRSHAGSPVAATDDEAAALRSARATTMLAIDTFERSLASHAVEEGRQQGHDGEASRRNVAVFTSSSTSRTQSTHPGEVANDAVGGPPGHPPTTGNLPSQVDGWLHRYAAYQLQLQQPHTNNPPGLNRQPLLAQVTTAQYRVLCNPLGLNVFVFRFVLGNDATREAAADGSNPHCV